MKLFIIVKDNGHVMEYKGCRVSENHDDALKEFNHLQDKNKYTAIELSKINNYDVDVKSSQSNNMYDPILSEAITKTGSDILNETQNRFKTLCHDTDGDVSIDREKYNNYMNSLKNGMSALNYNFDSTDDMGKIDRLKSTMGEDLLKLLGPRVKISISNEGDILQITTTEQLYTPEEIRRISTILERFLLELSQWGIIQMDVVKTPDFTSLNTGNRSNDTVLCKLCQTYSLYNFLNGQLNSNTSDHIPSTKTHPIYINSLIDEIKKDPNSGITALFKRVNNDPESK